MRRRRAEGGGMGEEEGWAETLSMLSLLVLFQPFVRFQMWPSQMMVGPQECSR